MAITGIVIETGEFVFDSVMTESGEAVFGAITESGKSVITLSTANVFSINDISVDVDFDNITLSLASGVFAIDDISVDVDMDIVTLQYQGGTFQIDDISVDVAVDGNLQLSINQSYLDDYFNSIQDSSLRKPLVNIISSPTIADIPFTGNYLSNTSNQEFNPYSLTLSNDTVVCVHAIDNNLKFTYTNVDGTEFENLIISISNSIAVFGISLCELPTGNVGITYIVDDGTYYRLKYRIVSPVGVAVSDGEIGYWSRTLFTSQTALINKGTNDYLLIYVTYNGSNYILQYRTSSDFINWSIDSEITISGITTTNKIDNPFLMIERSIGDLWLWFDYVESINSAGNELRNIYYSKSSDGGSSWGAATKFTNFTTYTAIGKHPFALQKTLSDMYVFYNKEQTSMATSSQSGFPISVAYNSTDNTINVLRDTPKIINWDVTDWSEIKHWDDSSVPAIDSITVGINCKTKIGNNYVPVVDGNGRFVDVLSISDDTFTNYNFVDVVGYRTKNVTFSDNYVWNTSNYNDIFYAQIDEINHRLWLALQTDWYLTVGYLDLNQTGPNYTFNVVLSSIRQITPYWIRSAFIIPEQDFIIFNTNQGASGTSGVTEIYLISTGTLYKSWTHSTYDGFPKQGLETFCYYMGYLYGGFVYDNSVGEVDKRGLFKLEIASDAMTYHRPTYATVDDYDFRDIITGRENKLLLTNSDSVIEYDIVNDTWTVYNDDNVPGLVPLFGNEFHYLLYDSNNDYIFVTAGDSWSTGVGQIIMFPGTGELKRSNYYLGALSGGIWNFTDEGILTQNQNEFNAVGSLDPLNNNSMYVFWETGDGDIKWAKDGSSVDITQYLLSSVEVSIKRTISDSDPHELKFTCANGHLFDEFNTDSILREALKKGRKLVVKWGEKIFGVDYWLNAGTFFITKRSVNYERSVYPAINVIAQDIRCLWQEIHIYSTEYYNNYPEDIISDLITKYTNLVSSDIDLPLFANRIVLEHQWVDVKLLDVLKQICERFGYFLAVTEDNKITAKRISDSNDIDHIYSDLTKLLNFSPDDEYSDFTNRVTVIGQEKTYIEVLYPEERIQRLNGTVGWWGCKKDYHIPYSEDESRTCVNPRLVVLESVSSLGFMLANLDPLTGFDAGDIKEYISYIDINNHYCTVVVEVPNLLSQLVQMAAGLVASYFIPDTFEGYGAGITNRIGSALTAIMAMGISGTLSAIANFQFEIWATPKGRVRRSVQGSEDDENHQKEIGQIVEKVIEDPLCYSVFDCQYVAGLELLVVKLQRKGAKFNKITYIQDNEGMTIQHPHPYTGNNMKFFINSITRRFKKAESEDGNGYFKDEIEAWLL